MNKGITRITAWKLAKLLLHDMYDRVGHYPFQGGYSFTCRDGRIAVKAATLRRDTARWDFRLKNINADNVMFVAFNRELKIDHVWFMPADILDKVFKVRADDVDVWNKYEIDINWVKNFKGLG